MLLLLLLLFYCNILFLEPTLGGLRIGKPDDENTEDGDG